MECGCVLCLLATGHSAVKSKFMKLFQHVTIAVSTGLKNLIIIVL